jgi:peptidoglycan/LPS O-acetylase OafA/YrhL
MKNDKPTIYSLQMLRAVAAALVLLAHCQNFLHARGQIAGLNPWIHFGSVGVDIFFVISGFIMVFVSVGKFEQPGASRDFMIRRVIRVVPMYWLYTLIIGALLFAFPHYFSGGKQFAVAHFAASLFFVPWGNDTELIKPVLGVGWTLNFEMYFYLVFALLLVAPAKLFLPLLSFVMLAGIALGEWFGMNNFLLSVVTSPLVIEFLIGCLIGVIYMKGVVISRFPATLLLLAGIVGFIFGSTPLLASIGLDVGHPVGDYERLVKWGVPAGLLITGIVYLEQLKAIRINRLLVELGDSSYSLYLTHIFVINAVGVLWIRLFHEHYNAYMAFAFIASIVVGHLAYLLIEKPVTRYLNNSYRSRKKNRVLMPC